MPPLFPFSIDRKYAMVITMALIAIGSTGCRSFVEQHRLPFVAHAVCPNCNARVVEQCHCFDAPDQIGYCETSWTSFAQPSVPPIPPVEFEGISQRPADAKVVTASAMGASGASIRPATSFRIHDLDTERSPSDSVRPRHRLVIERLNDEAEATFDYFTP